MRSPFPSLPAMLAALLIAFAVIPRMGAAQTFSASPSFVGKPGGSLSESMLGVGPSIILELTPHWVGFYDKNGTELSSTHVNTFFADQLNGGAVSGDPVCYYDALRGRYLMVVMGTSSQTLLWISKENADPSDPANWWKYKFIDGSRDYPGLGVSDDKIAVRVDNSNKIYVLDRQQAYDGLYANDPGVSPISAPGAWVKPCRNTTNDSTIHLVGRATGAITYWTITGPADSLVLTGPMSITVPDAPGIFGDIGGQQPDTSAFNSCGPRLLRGHVAAPVPAAYTRNGNVTVTWTVERDYADGSPSTSAIRVIRFRTSDQAVLDDFQIGEPGMTYAWGSAVEDDHGTLFVGYDRFSPNEYPSCYMVARRGGHQSPEFLVKAGVSSYLNCVGYNCSTPTTSAAWGDYTGIVLDEFTSGPNASTARYVGQWTPGTHTSGTAIGAIHASYGGAGVSGSVRMVPPGAGGQPQGVPLELLESGVVVARAEANASGNWTFGLIPAGTYVVRMALDPSVAFGAVAGGGGTVISNHEVQFTLGQDELSIGTEFQVSVQPAPLIDSLSATQVEYFDPDFDLVVYGQNFQPYSVVRFDGRDKETTFDGTGQLTARIQHDDIVYTGPHSITVYTPAAPSGGVSAAATLETKHRYIVSEDWQTAFAACPSGDGGRLTGTIVMRNDAACQVDVTSLEAKLTLYSLGATAWGATEILPPYLFYEIPGSVSYDPVTQLATITFDFGEFSGCSEAYATWQYRSNASAAWKTGATYMLDIRSYDLDPLVHGAVDRFDTDALGALLGTTEKCGDFNFSGNVDAVDLAIYASHLGHHYHERLVVSPNGGESFVRQPGESITIPITWSPGAGDSATVMINLIDGGTSATIAANLPDDGSYDWDGGCGVPISQEYRIEVVHTAGVYLPGDPTLGSDQSDDDFSIIGSCTGGGGGCPFLDTWTAAGWTEENSVLGRSANGELIEDFYKLSASPELGAEGVIRLRLREDEMERTRLARARLVTVDRGVDEVSRIVAGNFVSGAHETAWKVTSSLGRDLTPLLTGESPVGYEASPGEVLTVELFPENSGVGQRFLEGEFGGAWITAMRKEISGNALPRGGDAYDQAVLEQSGVVVQVADREGRWAESSRLYPREKLSAMGIVTRRMFQLRFVGQHRIGAVGWIRLSDAPPITHSLAPLAARHNEAGDVVGVLRTDGSEVIVSPGQAVEFTFRAPLLREGYERDYYFVARGVYTTLTPELPGRAEDLPVTIQLYGARPNPTRGLGAQIGFALPRTAHVEMRIFDTQGRLVRTLVDAPFEAGRHEVRWDSRDASGRVVPSGVYFYKMQVGDWQQERKVIVSG